MVYLNKRFSGLLYVYGGVFCLKEEGSRVKIVLRNLFESLILNGLLTYGELKRLSINAARNSKSTDLTTEYPNLLSKFPLSLQNFCRLVIKNNMKRYTRDYVHQLPLPFHLKRFVYFESECENVLKV
jgi:hypothetical protein